MITMGESIRDILVNHNKKKHFFSGLINMFLFSYPETGSLSLRQFYTGQVHTLFYENLPMQNTDNFFQL